MFDGLSTMLWLKRKHLRASANFWLWAAGADLDDTRDLSERIYLLYVAVIVCGCTVACWLWILGLVTGSAQTDSPEMAAVTADIAPLIAGAALALPVCAAALWSVRAAWRAPWAVSAPDAAWLAQTPVALAGWNLVDLVPRMAARCLMGGAAGYLVAAFVATALGTQTDLVTCLPYAMTAGLMTGAAYTLAWIVGEVRLRMVGRRRLALVCAIAAAGIMLVVTTGALLPRFAGIAQAPIFGKPGASAPIAAAAGTLLLVATSAVVARTLPACALTCDAGDASVYAVRRMAVYNPKLYRSLIKSRRAARRRPIGHMPCIRGTATVLARSAISLVRRYDMLPQLLGAGAVLAPMGVALLSGSLAEMSAASGMLGGATGGRILGAASWLLFALSCSELPRAIARTFTDDMGNRFMRDHLPVSTAALLALDALPALAVTAAASLLVCTPIAWGSGIVSALGAFSSVLALDIVFALCGALDAAERTPGRPRLSCESALGLTALVSAAACALMPPELVPFAFWATAAIVGLVTVTALR
ncbi:hypothetical protein [Collinsella tanakaei]|uniref:hypothetical protein n=1 Tax=Collinsella tanakaei TaxID=626935 RepID=UPI0025A39446|nr:hypothetical protein [Collinsella tanakaei]MDM8299569.1 hypothetical protein [Collinsella tanakaei]